MLIRLFHCTESRPEGEATWCTLLSCRDVSGSNASPQCDASYTSYNMSLRPLTLRDFVHASHCVHAKRRCSRKNYCALPCSRTASNSSPGNQFTALFASSVCQPSANPNLASAALLEKSIVGAYSSLGV